LAAKLQLGESQVALKVFRVSGKAGALPENWVPKLELGNQSEIAGSRRLNWLGIALR